MYFERILETIPDNEMIKPYQPRSKAELREDNQKIISPEQQHFYLAFYAKDLRTTGK